MVMCRQNVSAISFRQLLGVELGVQACGHVIIACTAMGMHIPQQQTVWQTRIWIAAQGFNFDLPYSVCAPVIKAGTASVCMTIFYMLYKQCLICFIELDAAYELTYAWHFLQSCLLPQLRLHRPYDDSAYLSVEHRIKS